MAVKAGADPEQSTFRKMRRLFLCLFDSLGVKEVLTMQDGLLSTSLQGKTIIDLTTNHFNDVIEFHALVEAQGGNYLI